MGRRRLQGRLAIAVVIGIATGLVRQGDDAVAAAVAQAPVQSPAPEIDALIAQLRTASSSDAAAAFQALVKKQSAAVPALQTCLADRGIRLTCVEILTRITPRDSTPVLLQVLNSTSEANSQDGYFKPTSSVDSAASRPAARFRSSRRCTRRPRARWPLTLPGPSRKSRVTTTVQRTIRGSRVKEAADVSQPSERATRISRATSSAGRCTASR